jgi:hypothetical protein
LMAFLHVYTDIFSSQIATDPRYEAVLRRMRIAR